MKNVGSLLDEKRSKTDRKVKEQLGGISSQ